MKYFYLLGISLLFPTYAFGALTVTVQNDPINPAQQSSTLYSITKDLTYVFVFLFNPAGNSYGDMVDPAINTTTATLDSFAYANAINLQEGVNTAIILQSNSANNASGWNPYCGSGKTITDCEVASTAEDDFIVQSPTPTSTIRTMTQLEWLLYLSILSIIFILSAIFVIWFLKD